MSFLKKIQVWLNTDNHYEVVRFWIAMAVAAIVVVVLLLQTNSLKVQNETLKKQNDSILGLTRATKDNSDRNILYTECISKIFIVPRDPNRGIAGDIDDPRTAVENCRIEAGLPEEAPTPEQGSAPSNEPSQERNSQPQNQKGQSNQDKPKPEEPEEPPEPPQSIIPILDEPILGCQLGLCL